MAIAFVNSATGFSTGSVTNVSSGAFALTAGNSVYVGVRVNSTLETAITGVTDTAGNLYRFVSGGSSGSSGREELWYCQNATANASNAVKATFSGGFPFVGVVCAQFSGVATTSSLDVYSFAPFSTSTSIVCNAITTSVAAAVLIMVAQAENSGLTYTAGSGYTVAVTDTNGTSALQYQIVSTIQSAVTPTITTTSATSKSGACASFNAPIGGGGGGEVSVVIGG